MAHIIDEDYVLNNGVRIPKLAFGTWQIPDGEAAEAVCKAIRTGYRYIDSAVDYGNERGVGEGLRRSGADRGSIFITTKILAEQKTYEGAAASIDASLERLGTDYADLMLIHAPKPWAEIEAGSTRKYFKENLAVWKAMEEAYEAGKVRAIGVSNFSIEDVANILQGGRIRPAVNQVKVHVGHTPFALLDWCRTQGILVQAYCPNGHGSLLSGASAEAGLLAQTASRYGVSVPQICIRYDLQLGTLPIPKTTNEAHMRQNAEVDFVITDADMELLKAVART
ncbi:MAG: aldo/keto reductase [Bacteroidales bacterium]|nr:aldo/keto reductase [Bacteroidales bacterium]